MLTLIAKPMDLLGISHCHHYGDSSTLFTHVIFGRLEQLQKELQTHHNVNVTDDTAATPLMYAVLLGHKIIVTELLEHGADIAHGEYDAKILAELSNQHDILELLNQNGMRPQ